MLKFKIPRYMFGQGQSLYKMFLGPLYLSYT
jgi:hypothetical protein